MARKRDQATWLTQLLTEWARVPVIVAWEAESPGRGDWWVRWTDGPAAETLRAQAQTYAVHMRPLDVATLRWSRVYTPRSWALALLTVAKTRPEVTDWHELVGVAETWLVDADWPDRATSDVDAAAVDHLLAAGDGREYEMARVVLASRRPTEHVATKPRDETRCATCGTPVTRAGTGRPARYCSPACRTRAWRTRTTKPGDETAR